MGLLERVGQSDSLHLDLRLAVVDSEFRIYGWLGATAEFQPY